MAIGEMSNLAQTVASDAVIACWFVFLASFGLRKRTARPQSLKRDPTAIFGMLMEGSGYFLVWYQRLHRARFVPVMAGSRALEWGLTALIVAMAVGSTWLVDAASRRLGKQWALAAQVVEGHTLIEDGPYSFVRNPIYLGMFGLLVATGLVKTQWGWLIIASLLFVVGTWIRISREERLLGEAFGEKFEAYKKRVPTLLPGFY